MTGRTYLNRGPSQRHPSRSILLGLLLIMHLIAGPAFADPTSSAMDAATGNLQDVPTFQPERCYALVVGISDYLLGVDRPAGPAGIWDLNYSDDDALAVRNALQHAGWPDENVRLLCDSSATKARLVDGLTWLTSHAPDADCLLFYFSGHGTSAVPDLDGDEALLCPGDTCDEALVPYNAVDLSPFTKEYLALHPDMLALYYERLLIDDELYALLAPAGVPVIVVLDSCFAGGSMRGSGQKSVKLIRQESMTLLETAGAAREVAAAAAENALPETLTVLAASQDQQYSHEDPSHRQGYFTYWLLRPLTDATVTPLADKNGDGRVDLAECFAYAQANLPRALAPGDRPQDPLALHVATAAGLSLAAVEPPTD